MTSRPIAVLSADRRTRFIWSPRMGSRAGRASPSRTWPNGLSIPSCAGSQRRRDLAQVTALQVPLCRLPHGRDMPLPGYASDGAAGLDLLAAVAEPMELAPGARKLIPTGIMIALPAGYEAQVRPRSGLALRHGVTLLNSPGTIDSDYRGEIMVLMVNLGDRPYTVRRGDRIAQMIVAPVTRAELQEVDALAQSRRGEGGFGHTDEE